MIKRYTTIQGDMWDFIAFKIYGSERFMDALLEANPDHAETIVLPAGIELDCPEVSRNAPPAFCRLGRRGEGVFCCKCS